MHDNPVKTQIASVATVLIVGLLLIAIHIYPRGDRVEFGILLFSVFTGLSIIGTVLIGAKLTWGNALQPLALDKWPEDRRQAVLMISLALTVSLLLNFVVKEYVHSQPRFSASSPIPDWNLGSLLITAIAWTVIAPLAEELFFRGYLFKLARNYGLSFWVTAILTTVLWVPIHVGRPWPMILVLFPIGIILAVVRERSKSLFVPIAVHGAFNFYQSMLFILVMWAINPSTS